ncbi:MAG: beta-glucosidase [Kiritimatiellaceae bacterium]|nr:beta-glucosidase [Kiritimatiellaceae bacterium]
MSAPYKNSGLPVKTRVTDLLARMTREEKLGQIVQLFKDSFKHDPEKLTQGLRKGRWGSRIGAETAWAGNDNGSALDLEECNAMQRVAIEESRLGIPLILGRDVIYGHRTVFPIPHSQAASFNPKLIERAMTAVAAEASSEGIHWTFSPMLDLVRDPRWGRVIESFGEDPFLISEMGKAAVRGFQGDNPAEPGRLLACAKHFAGYGGSEGGRDYDTTEWTDNTLHNMILPPFRAAAEAGVATMMAGFNDLGGTPVSASRTLMRDWLKTELGWDGFIVSDWGSIFDLIGHGVAKDQREAALRAFTAGIDMEMTAGIYEREIGKLIDSGEIPVEWLDEAVARILRAKFRAGLFEHPYTDPARAATVMRHPDHIKLAAELATQSVVLLKNERQILPLAPDVKKVAVLGPYAEARREHLGSWCLDGRPGDVTSILDGLRAAAPNIEFITANAAFSDATIDAARQAELTILCLGESHLRNGENKSIVELALPPGQEELIAALGKLGLPFVVVDCSGRYLPSPAAEIYAAAILHAGCLGTEAGTAIARVLLGQASPSGKLPITVPRCTGQIPIYYNRKTVGKTATFLDRYRGYEDERLTPLYRFGYGLSYTTLSLTNACLSATTMAADGEATFSATLTNTGKYAGAEVVQLYIGDPVASTGRPARELKGFQRIELAPGASAEVSFQITAKELRFYTANCKWEVEPGEFRLAIGTDSSAPFTHTLTVV